MKKNPRTKEQPLAEIEGLRRRLEEADETLRAIREGEVDALVVSKPQGEVVFTLKGAEQPYRVFVETMNEGAATLDPEGTVLYCNNRFAEMLKISADKVIGSSIFRFIPSTDRSGFESAFQGGQRRDTTLDISLRRENQEVIPVHLSLNMLHGQETPVICVVAMDLTEHKRMEEALRQLNADLEKRVQERTGELADVNEKLRAEIDERKEAEGTLRQTNSTLAGINRILHVGLTCETEAELGRACLDIAEKITQSRFGFIGEINKDGLEDIAISNPGWEACRILGPSGHRGPTESFKIHGIYGRVVSDGKSLFTNDPAHHPDSIGLPKGHPPLQSFLGVPLIREERVIGILAVGNREGGYTQVQQDTLEVLTPAVVEAFMRIRAEEEIRRSHDELELRVQERTSELAKANEALRQLSSRLLSAQEEERKRIAGEIHDTLGVCLSAIKFKVEGAVQQIGETATVATQSFGTILPVIQEGIEECRRMQQDLRPSILDDLGLLATLSWFCRRYEAIYTGIKVESGQALEESDIPNALKIVIFRVTQEGMNNIAKHSKADLVRLFLRKMDGRIELVLKDNGQGFDLKKVLASESTKRGLGLTSMRERTQLSGGSFAIESTEGKGTTIRASWPLNQSC
jgi:PAS domain S-box-containing protein